MIPAVLALIFQNPLDAPVTHQGPTDNLAVVMVDVAKQANVKITVQGAPERDYVYLQVKDRPLRKVLDLVAEATQSEWSEIAPNEFKIHAPWPQPEDLIARQAQIQAWLDKNPDPGPLTADDSSKMIEEAMEALKTKESPLQGPTLDRLDDRTPVNRALFALLHELGAEKLAAIPEGPALEFRLHPTGRAEPFPPRTKAIVTSLDREAALFGQALAKKGVTSADAMGERAPGPELYRYAMNGVAEPGIDWKFSIDRQDQEVMARAMKVDQKGNYVAPWGHVAVIIRAYPSRAETPFKDAVYPFSWPPDIKPLILTSTTRAEFMRTRVYPAPALDRLRACAKSETLTRGLEAPFAAYAQGEKCDLIAIVPDELIHSLLFLPADQPEVSEVLTRVYIDPHVSTFEGARIIRNRLLNETRAWRLPRPEAARAFEESATIGNAHLSTQAAALNAGGESSFSWLTHALRLIGGLQNYDEDGLTALRIFATLSPGTREAALSRNVSFNVGGLPPETRREVEKLVFSPFTALIDEPGAYGMKSGTDSDSSLRYSYADVTRMRITLRVAESPSIYWSTSPTPSDPTQMASLQELAGLSSGQLRQRLFCLINTEKLHIQVAAHDGKLMERSCSAIFLRRPVRWIKYQELPESIRQSVESLRKARGGGGW